MQPLHTTFALVDRSTADGSVLSSRAIDPITAQAYSVVATQDELRRRGEEGPVFRDEVQTTVQPVPPLAVQLRPAR